MKSTRSLAINWFFGLAAVAIATQINLPIKSAETGFYSQEQINYFLEVATGSEFGQSTPIIRRWQEPIRIKVHGAPTKEDLAALNQTIQDIESLTDGPQVDIVYDLPNIDVYFASESQFHSIEPNYQPLNYGFFWTYWNEQSEIYRARVLISTTGVSQTERSHLIREELTQSLGLMQDSSRYQDSIFFQGWTDLNQYAEVDRAAIQMLYHPEVKPGMTRSQVIEAFARHER